MQEKGNILMNYSNNKNKEIGIFIANYLSRLFFCATKKGECSSLKFYEAFLSSSLIKEIFNEGFIYSGIDTPLAYETLKKEKKLTKGDLIYPSYAMEWSGYIIAYLIYFYDIEPFNIKRKIKIKDFMKAYNAYHSLDNDLVSKKLIEDFSLKIELNRLNVLKSIYLK